MPVLSVHVQTDIRLPIELLSIIINELGSNPEALASCRLASHVLCSLTTPLLFSSLKLTVPKVYGSRLLFLERARKMNQVLSNCNVAASVHTFHLLCEKSLLKDSTIGPLILKILYQLPHVRTFRLEGRDPLGMVAFCSFPRDISSAIQALCKSPTLITLELCNIGFLPITVITTCCNVRSIHLESVRFNTDDVNPTSSLQPFYLDSLKMDMSALFLSSDISRNKSLAKHFSRIRSLSVDKLFECGGLRLGWDMILLASQSLTTLNLSLDRGYSREDFSDLLKYFPFDLDRLPALRHFKLKLPTALGYILSVPSYLSRLFSIPSSTSCLETLELLIHSWCHVEEEDAILEEPFSSNAEWDTLDEVLAEKFVSLGKFVLGWNLQVYFVLDRDHREVTDDFRSSSLAEYQILGLSYVNDLFPKLRRGQCTLETQFTVSSSYSLH